MQSLGLPVTPFNLQLIFSWMLRWFTIRYWQRALQTDVAIAPHANAARDEMRLVGKEVLTLLHASSVPTPTLDSLLAALDAPVLP